MATSTDWLVDAQGKPSVIKLTVVSVHLERPARETPPGADGRRRFEPGPIGGHVTFDGGAGPFEVKVTPDNHQAIIGAFRQLKGLSNEKTCGVPASDRDTCRGAGASSCAADPAWG